jgi:hypothetical protein
MKKTLQELCKDSDDSTTWFVLSISSGRNYSYSSRMQNPLTRMARTHEGHDVAIRVIAIKNEGREHLGILRKVGTGPNAFLSNNHVLPMLSEFHFHDVVFGIFPKVGWTLEDAYRWWAKNSVGDVVNMLMQALEVSSDKPYGSEIAQTHCKGRAFIHDLKVAHRVCNGFLPSHSVYVDFGIRTHFVTIFSSNGIPSPCVAWQSRSPPSCISD